MLKYITSGWTLLKFVRVGLGLLILFSGIEAGSAGNIFLGSLFTLLAVVSPGTCCVGGSCYSEPTANPKNAKQDTELIEYEELASK